MSSVRIDYAKETQHAMSASCTNCQTAPGSRWAKSALIGRCRLFWARRRRRFSAFENLVCSCGSKMTNGFDAQCFVLK